MNRLIGILLVLTSAAAFGSLAIFGRFAFAAGLDTATLLFLRFSLAAICMAALLVARGEAWPRGKLLLALVGMGAIGYVGQSYAYLTAIQYASAGLVYASLAFAQGPRWPTTPAGWGSVAGIVVLATVIPVTTFLAGLKRIDPTDASMLSTLEPAVTVFLAAVLLGESLPPLSLLGGGLILAAVVLLTRQPG